MCPRRQSVGRVRRGGRGSGDRGDPRKGLFLVRFTRCRKNSGWDMLVEQGSLARIRGSEWNRRRITPSCNALSKARSDMPW